MKILLRNISDVGLEHSFVFIAQDLDIPADALKIKSPVAVEAVFTRAGDEVLATFATQATYGLTCSRCLIDFEVEKHNQFDLAFDVESSTEEIDFKNELREELIIANSVFALCSEKCKGLCAQCGQNLNRRQCKCV